MKDNELNQAILTVIKAGYSVHSPTHWISDQSDWYFEPTFNVTRHRRLRGTLYSNPKEAVEIFLKDRDS